MRRPNEDYEEVPADDIDEYVDIEQEDEPSKPVRTPAKLTGVRTTLGSLAVSCAMILFCGYRTGIGMMNHTDLESIHTIEFLMVADLPVIILGGAALVATRPHEGTALRGAAIVSSAISFVVEMILGNSLGTLLHMGQ